MTEPVISLQNMSLRLRLQSVRRLSAISRTPKVTPGVGGRIERDSRNAYVVALDSLNLDINHGDRVALIGHNGAGKSSLLRVMAGIYTPTGGRCIVRGKQSCLLNASLGLSGDASLIENIRMALTLYGTDFREIDDMIPGILEFAELTEFAEIPLNACSSGMKARLGFSVATSVEPDVFLVDEAISAGDARFAKKAQKRIDALFKYSSTLVLSAHSPGLLRMFCNKALWLENGKIRAFGRLNEVLTEFAK